ncbi:MAG: polyribonucleotide nucleotidyltransferase [Alphaproteobacteria bacterium 43-37]|nr:MAG: polyribonucleotide nucleotidyltransferase [Alphaproteobacteria bacterium 43-37]
MFNIITKTLNWGGRQLKLETGKIARQATGSVVATYGETSVLCTVVGAKAATPGIDFLPLSVHYQEKSFSVGKIPGGFFKREGRPSEKETLVSRLIDRPIRPLFVEGFHHEVQVVCTVLSYDLENDSDIVALVGASAALTLSGLPFLGPVGGVKVGYKDGTFILNPTVEQLEESDLDLVVAGTQEGVLMVESEAKELSEKVMLDAVMFGHENYQPVIDLIIQMAEECAHEPWEIPEESAEVAKMKEALEAEFEATLREAYKEKVKQNRYKKIDAAKSQAIEKFTEQGFDSVVIGSAFKALEAQIVRQDILKSGQRIDGRDTKTIRPIVSEVGLLPKTHGSALFTRGETQALVVATLGTAQDEQIIDALEGEYREHFMLHYNFPPFSVGEVGRLSSPGRREIGHGRLAWRAIRPMLPNRDAFPYTIRVVSEITESNGSSSMATVCGASLSMMDAGVPLPKAVAGIAMGLIKEGKKFAVLSDILGDEDHLGDMDFKVAGTQDGVTALQMDIKITSITKEIMKQALEQACEGRLHILKEMAKGIDGSREAVSSNAPRIVTISIPKDKIREVIGTGGKVIREICETTGAKIDIDDDGTVRISSTNSEALDAALARVKAIACEPEIGEVYSGKVVKVMEFGAFVNFLGTRDGLVHISELSAGRPAKVADVVKVGDVVKVKVIGHDERGKIKLSMKSIEDSVSS